MILLTAEKITKSYSEKILLDNISFGINEGDKIGIIGVNGAGKSTLLKIIAGLETPDSGTITKSGSLRVGYLPQNPEFEEDMSVLQQMLKGFTQREQEAKEYECKNILTRLGLKDFDKNVCQLSGGQKKRVAMASALVHEVDLLILDEPTNHIDNFTVDWLEGFLSRYKGAVVMITHDRYFLDRVTNKIFELKNGSIRSYTANYTKYLEEKEQYENMLAASQRKRQSLLRKELEWLQQGPKARGTKSRYRIERYEEMSQQNVSISQSKLDVNTLSTRLGKEILKIDGLTKSFGSLSLMEGLSYHFLRDDRLGIIGVNGAGKSTLLKIICGEIAPDSGTVQIGETVKIGFFSQECQDMDLSQKAIDYIKNIAPDIQTKDGTLSASQMLEKFLFSSQLQYTTIGRLSGGERRRLYLLGILMQAPNLLLLDEPTNDLDVETLTILEDYLEGFPGPVIAVSHDRYFLDKIAHHVLAFEGDGKVKLYLGGYTDYMDAYQEAAPKAKETPTTKEKPRSRSEKLKFTYKEQREYEEVDSVIASLEQAIVVTQKEMDEKASDYSALQELTTHREQLEKELAHQMERWVYLNDLADRIQAQE